MPRPAQIPPPARRESQVAARARLRQSAAAGVGAAGLARGAPASAAASQLAHSASAAAAHPLPDSVRPGAGREPPGRLMGAALRAVADSRAGSAPGLAGARTQAEGGGPPPEVRRRGEPPASPLDGGSVEKPERSGDTSPPPTEAWVWGSSPGSVCLRAGPMRRREGCPTLQTWHDASSPGPVRLPVPSPPHLTPLPRTGLGLGISPRVGRPSGRHSAGGGGGLVPRAWRSASGLGTLGPPAFFPMMQLPWPEWLRSGDTIVPRRSPGALGPRTADPLRSAPVGTRPWREIRALGRGPSLRVPAPSPLPLGVQGGWARRTCSRSFGTQEVQRQSRGWGHVTRPGRTWSATLTRPFPNPNSLR